MMTLSEAIQIINSYYRWTVAQLNNNATAVVNGQTFPPHELLWMARQLLPRLKERELARQINQLDFSQKGGD
jgi:hypothetical protein